MAILITRTFDPVFEIPLLIGMVVWYTTPWEQIARVVSLLFLFYMVIPAIFFIGSIRKGRISDWDITNKAERKAIYFFSVASHFVGILAILILRQTFLAKILLVLWVVSLVFMIINFYWKISVHACINALVLVVLNEFWGFKLFGWLFVVLLLVLWSRVYLKKHSISQVIAGALLAYILVDLGFVLIGI